MAEEVNTQTNMIPRANSYFSGMGLMDMGLMEAGVDVRQSVDLDKDAIDSMKLNKHRFNHQIVWKDIKEMKVLNQIDCDVMVMTYPCTKYSTAGDIHGTRTGDDLYLHAFRHIALKQPEMYVLENVPGMKKFPIVMEAMSKLPQYYVTVFCPVETTNWLPQKRDRLIMIASKKPFSVQHPVSERRVSMKDIVEKDVEMDIPDYIYNRINGDYRDMPIIVDNETGIAPTCVAHYQKDQGTRMVKDRRYPHGIRPFTIREYARLQGVPDDIKFSGKKSDYRLIGNGVPVPMARWVGTQIMRYFN